MTIQEPAPNPPGGTVTVQTKSIFTDPTFWIEVVTPVAAWVAGKYGFNMDSATINMIAGALAALSTAVITSTLNSSQQPVHVVAAKAVSLPGSPK